MNLTLFDLDGTLLPIDTDHAFNEHVLSLGWAQADEFRRRNDAFYADYLAGRLDIHAYIDFATSSWRERSPQEITDAGRTFVEARARPAVQDAALDLVRQHRERGDQVAIVTATNDFVTRPVAALFGIDVLIATELERDIAGRVTGRIHGVPAFREGKVERVSAWLSGQGLRWDTFERTTFYSDSINDLPLLERVSHPVATNPGEGLSRIAAERGWPILRLFHT